MSFTRHAAYVGKREMPAGFWCVRPRLAWEDDVLVDLKYDCGTDWSPVWRQYCVNAIVDFTECANSVGR